ncbi:hypothetical protein AGMMS49944_03900 [Spirochaetia bacterium]|nr:hypothetical protein AGMMS49944_03900 [Spirochaetia bacterium]
MSSYRELSALQAPAEKVFFAFSEEQLLEGLAKIGATREEVVSGVGGVIGREADVREFHSFYEKNIERMAKECTVDEVFRHEWWNHECGLTGDCEEAMEIAKNIFGEDCFKDYDLQGTVRQLQKKFNEIN